MWRKVKMIKKVVFGSVLTGSEFVINEVEVNETVRDLIMKLANDDKYAPLLSKDEKTIEAYKQGHIDTNKSRFDAEVLGKKYTLQLDKPIIDSLDKDHKSVESVRITYALAAIVGAVVKNKAALVFAKLIQRYFGNCNCTVAYHKPQKGSSNRSERDAFLFTIEQFPVFGTGSDNTIFENVFLEVPSYGFTVDNDQIITVPFYQSQMGLWQGTVKTGNGFHHPHIHECGEPCLNDGGITSITTLYDWLISTLTYSNICVDSIKIGKLASTVLCENRTVIGKSADQVVDEVMNKVKAHRISLKKCLGDIMDRNAMFPAGFFNDYFGLMFQAEVVA